MTYQLYNSNGNLEGVILLQDNKRICIPIEPDNTDYQAYLKWVAEGNTPEPAEGTE